MAKAVSRCAVSRFLWLRRLKVSRFYGCAVSRCAVSMAKAVSRCAVSRFLWLHRFCAGGVSMADAV